jgi:enoyl-CoA hydratase
MQLSTMSMRREDEFVTVILNQPRRMNVIGDDFLRDLSTVLDDIEANSDDRTLIITGAENVFAAGADIKQIVGIETAPAAHAFVTAVQRVFNRIETLERPVIAAVNGLALGGGCELALACDIRIASEKALFGLPEIKLGVLPGAGGTQRLPRLIGAGRAKELLFSGDPVSAEEAFRIGLANRVVAAETLMNAAENLAKRFSRRAPLALKLIKSAVDRGMSMDLKTGLEYEARCFEILFTTEDREEGMQAFLAKRDPVFRGK